MLSKGKARKEESSDDEEWTADDEEETADDEEWTDDDQEQAYVFEDDSSGDYDIAPPPPPPEAPPKRTGVISSFDWESKTVRVDLDNGQSVQFIADFGGLLGAVSSLWSRPAGTAKPCS